MTRTRIPSRNALRVDDTYRNFGLPPTTGNVWYVHSSGSGGSTGGQSPDNAVTTLDAAVALCTASQGDIIVVMEGHAETITTANGIDLDVAGISVIGLGHGAAKPTITFGTLTTTTLRINAANVLLRNIRCVSGIDSLVKFIDVNADRCTIEDCDFDGPSTLEFLSGINIATTKDFTTIRNCYFTQGADPTGTDAAADTGAIFLVDSEHVMIVGCRFNGNFETACIHNRTTGAAFLQIEDCRGYCSLSGAEPIQLASGATGWMARCYFVTPAETATTEATLSGTFPALFFNMDSYFGNDGGGGQTGIRSTSDAS